MAAKQQTSVHFSLQGKGGVGKSLTSAYTAQFFESIGANVKCIDTDPVNHSLSNYKSLKVDRFELMDGTKLNERHFDKLLERMLSETGTFIIDNGASSFLPMANYLVENKAIEMLQEAGRRVYLHCVITGGPALADTVAGFVSLANQTKQQNLVLWMNEFFGPIEHKGVPFTEIPAYIDNKEKVLGRVLLAKRNADTFGKDIELLATKSMTFADALQGDDFTIMAKQRIKTVQRDVYDQLSEIGFE